MTKDRDDDGERPLTFEERLEALKKDPTPRGAVFEQLGREEQERVIRLDEERRKRANRKPSLALPLDYFADIEAEQPKRWLIKNVLARGEMSSWIGAPGAAKSALLTDIAVHAASSFTELWRGYKIREHCGVVYFALERAALVKRRLKAYRLRDQIELSTPIAVCGKLLDLLNPQCINSILFTIAEAEQRFGKAVGLIIIDSFSKGISGFGGDEDKAKDQNKVAAHMRRIIERQELHIAGIGHTGKDESRGERGSNARVADVDLRVLISGEQERTATIDKANDQDEGILTSFGMESVQTGQDEDGEPISSGIVSPLVRGQPGKIAPAPKRRGKRADAFREILRNAIVHTISRLLDDLGVKGLGLDLKPVVKLKVADLRQDLVQRGFLEMEGTRINGNSRQQFRHAKAALIADGKIMEKDGWIWNL